MTMVGLFYCEKSTSDLTIYNTLCQELATVTMVRDRGSEVIRYTIHYLLLLLDTLLLPGGSRTNNRSPTATASNPYPPQLSTSLVED